MGDVHLSLVSHTNVGKTSLMRTLMREDVGEVADRAHVTEVAESRVLVESPAGDALRVWDTPGLGDSARLLKRLEGTGNPLGWFLSKVWDRFADRPFYSSQQALRNARDESDVVLYLVNAAEDPASAGYAGMELQILGWIGKPVIVLLNQTGPARGAEAEARDEEAWRRHFASHRDVRAVLSLDAFARCWLHEDRLLGAVAEALPEAKQGDFARLRSAWRARNLETFAESTRVLAAALAEVAADCESIDDGDVASRAVRVMRSLARREGGDAAAERASKALALRLEARVRGSTDRLIALHGLAGRAKEEIPKRIAGALDIRRPAEVGASGLLGGIASGALGGLAADLSSGGLTLGAGMLIGGILGALGAGGAAHAYNVARGEDRAEVRWSPQILESVLAVLLLRYLAVAHFGRGRGAWVAGEYPAHWRTLAESIAGGERAAIEKLALQARAATRAPSAPEAGPLLDRTARKLLTSLYPDAGVLRPPPAPPP